MAVVSRRLTMILVFSMVSMLVAGLMFRFCGSGGATKDAPEKRFLLLMHSPLSGSLGRSDAELVTLGRQACTDLDQHMPSDQIVASLSGNAEPGSGSFNAYSFLVVSAATELCPDHKQDFQGGLGGLTGD